MDKITGIILAGGNSSRMGTDKALILFRGKKLIEYSIALMKEICHHILISANNQVYNSFGFPVIPDNFQGIGPLAGIEACLRYSQTRINLVVSCDTPFININLFRDILNNIENNQAVVPVLKGGKVEPLTGYYSKEILPMLIQQIEKRDYKMQNLLKQVNTKYIALADYHLLNNLNTPEDLINLEQPDTLKNCPNILLIAGTGRNAGKTMLACEIIRHLSKTADVIGVKISSHFHPVESGQKIVANPAYYHIIEETLHTSKDSSRMLQAGAKKVFYIQAKQDNLEEAFNTISAELSCCPVICESGGLHRYIKPGLFLFVRGEEIPENKKAMSDYDPVIVSFNNSIANVDVGDIYFYNNRICYTSQTKSSWPCSRK